MDKMKIAVSSCGISLDSPIDPRFGRCDYFLIIDTHDMSFEVFDNVNVGLTQGAGVQSARFVISKGAQAVITGNIGPNAIRALSAVGVEVVLCQEGSNIGAIEKYQKGEFKSVNGASVREHYGMAGKAAEDRMKDAKMADEKEKEVKTGDVELNEK
ncbi:MAG: NifB/NifX family molybdenum-iron cluster-binding protein [Deltaproteobacteria bacterium]|nr:NifB/NifX family molybdenum-iron cluster-binding protein [Deltaproteobacteria bacterium]